MLWYDRGEVESIFDRMISTSPTGPLEIAVLSFAVDV